MLIVAPLSCSCQVPSPPSIPSPSLKLLLSLSENMQMCESRLQPSPVRALQSSVLQDSGGKRKQDASLSSPLTRCARDACCSVFYFQRLLRTVTVPVVPGNAGMRDICTSLDAAKCHSPVSVVVMTAEKDIYKVKGVRWLQSNVQGKWRRYDTSFQKVTSSLLLCPDVSLWWKIQPTWVWWMNQVCLLSKIISQVIYLCF